MSPTVPIPPPPPDKAPRLYGSCQGCETKALLREATAILALWRKGDNGNRWSALDCYDAKEKRDAFLAKANKPEGGAG